MSETEQELAEKLVGSYAKMDGDQPASWAVFSDDMANYDIKLSQACHMSLRWYYDDLYDNIITALTPDTQEHIRYLTALINGPFRNFKDRIEIVGTEIGSRYIKCSKLGTWPAPVLYNFCIATRVFIEYSSPTPLYHNYVVVSFNRMIEAKVPDDLALVLSQFSYKKGGDIWDRKVDFLGPNGCHFWLNNKSDWVKVFEGAPKEIEGVSSYKSHPGSSTPCNDTVWGEDNKTYLLLKSKTVREIYEHYKEKGFFT